jgi:hypothetical protein
MLAGKREKNYGPHAYSNKFSCLALMLTAGAGPGGSIPGHVQQAQRDAAKVQSGHVNVGIEGGRQHYCPSSIRRARTTSENWSSVMPDTRPYSRPRSRVACHDRSRRRSRSSLAATSSTEMPSDEAIGSSSASRSGGRYVLLPFVATTLLSHAAAARPSRFRLRSRFHLHAKPVVRGSLLRRQVGIFQPAMRGISDEQFWERDGLE